MKPVYVGNSLDQSNNVDKRVYVKSSSFPLIPELTVGFQIEKIRKALEEFQDSKKEEFGPDGQPLFVRASFGTANKVGAVKNTATVFDDNGDVVDGFTIEDSNTLILERKNFRIQQDVPYKREKDTVNIGTQERKLLFADLLDIKIEPGVTGQDLLDSYQQDYEDLFKYSQEKLAKRLGITEEVTTGEDLGSLTIIPETDLVSEVETFNEELKKTKSPVAKIQKQEEFADKIGKDNLERINFINKNFDNIVKALTEGKVNIFFDENNQFKKCD
jgi:acylphosphatase